MSRNTYTAFGKRPLLIGCSGGGGHNAAIMAFAKGMQVPAQHRANIQLHQNAANDIRLGAKAANTNGLGKIIRAAIKATPFPVLPPMDVIKKEVLQLQASQSDNNGAISRPYIDMLLDVYPNGYESAAVWNVLQRQDKIKDIRKLIEFQKTNDERHCNTVKQHFLSVLQSAAESGNPYDDIICTQATGLAGLSDAIIAYNQWLDSKTEYQNYTRICAHIMLTDLPSRGCKPFLESLSRLNQQQRMVMRIHAVALKPKILDEFDLREPRFASYHKIDPKQNPMIRPGFNDPNLSTQFDQTVTLSLQAHNANDATITINENEKVASIMLGSQASDDTARYVKSLLKRNVDKIFVFGGNKPNIAPELDRIVKQYPDAEQKIIRLDNQDDIQMAPIMTRSNTVIIRGGGLSIMEQMALPHNPLQSILVHHAKQTPAGPTSGIHWEDENVNGLIAHLEQHNVFVSKTTVKSIEADLLHAELINLIKAFKLHVNDYDQAKLWESAVKNTFKTNNKPQKITLGDIIKDFFKRLVALFKQVKEKDTLKPLISSQENQHTLTVDELAAKQILTTMYELIQAKGINANKNLKITHVLDQIEQADTGQKSWMNALNATCQILNQSHATKAQRFFSHNAARDPCSHSSTRVTRERTACSA